MMSEPKWRMRDYLSNYRFNSMLVRNFLMIFLLCTVHVASLFAMGTASLRANARAQICEMTEGAVARTAGVVDALIQAMYELAYTFATDDETKALSFATRDSLSKDGRALDLMEKARFFVRAYDYVESVYFYYQASGTVLDRERISSIESFRDTTWLSMYGDLDERNFTVRARRKNDEYPYLITLIYPITADTRTPRGAVVISINAEDLGDFLGSGQYRSGEADSLLLIMDEAGALCYSDEYRLIHDEAGDFETYRLLLEDAPVFPSIYEANGRKWAVARNFSESTGFSYAMFVPLSRYDAQFGGMSGMLWRWLVLSLASTLLIAFAFTRLSFEPIRSLMDIAGHPTALDRGLDSQKRANEVMHIRSMLINARQRTSRLSTELEERMRRLNDAQLRALQSQINPHFLYNTLDSIAGAAICLTDSDNEVSDMIHLLGRLLRASLTSDSFLVPVGEELMHARMYVSIVEFGHKGRFSIAWKVEELPPTLSIVRLSLQPLLENAFKHGLRPKRYRGEIEVTGGVQGCEAWLCVSDNGVGIDEEHLRALNESFARARVPEGEHFGLWNINQRFRLIFGERFGVTLTSDGSHTAATLRFPASPAPADR